MKAYKFRICPNKEQTEKLEFALDICRQAYNLMLGELNEQVIIDRNMIQSILPDLKICEPKFRQFYLKKLQYECYRLFLNLSALKVLKKNKKKVGRLRFKCKGWFKTINYNKSGFSLDKENKKLNLSKIGNIKIKLYREVEGNIKFLKRRIKRTLRDDFVVKKNYLNSLQEYLKLEQDRVRIWSAFTKKEKRFISEPFDILIEFKNPENKVSLLGKPIITDIPGEVLMDDTLLKDLIIYTSEDKIKIVKEYFENSVDVRSIKDIRSKMLL